jgi:hypothetical protein
MLYRITIYQLIECHMNLIDVGLVLQYGCHGIVELLHAIKLHCDVELW